MTDRELIAQLSSALSWFVKHGPAIRSKLDEHVSVVGVINGFNEANAALTAATARRPRSPQAEGGVMAKDDFGRNEGVPQRVARFRIFTSWARLRRAFPRIGWTDLTPDEARELDLTPMVRWQALDFTWGAFGIVLAARPAHQANGGGDA